MQASAGAVLLLWLATLELLAVQFGFVWVRSVALHVGLYTTGVLLGVAAVALLLVLTPVQVEEQQPTQEAGGGA